MKETHACIASRARIFPLSKGPWRVPASLGRNWPCDFVDIKFVQRGVRVHADLHIGALHIHGVREQYREGRPLYRVRLCCRKPGKLYSTRDVNRPGRLTSELGTKRTLAIQKLHGCFSVGNFTRFFLHVDNLAQNTISGQENYGYYSKK